MQESVKTKPLICVFAGSSVHKDKRVIETASRLGSAIGAEGFDVVLGGGTGMMGVVAQAAIMSGAAATGVLIEKYKDEKPLSRLQVEVARDDSERFEMMAGRANTVGIVVLPGGFGTLREAFRALERANTPPVVLAQVGGYLDGMTSLVNAGIEGGTIKEDKKDALRVWSPGDSLRAVLKI